MRFVLPLLIILGSFAARSAIGKSRWEPPEGNGYDYLVFNQTKNTVDDGETARLPDAVNMTIKDVNHVPVALAQGDPPVAGRRAAVGAADSTALTEASDTLPYSWAQLAGSLERVAIACMAYFRYRNAYETLFPRPV